MNPIDELYRVATEKKKKGHKVITLDYVLDKLLKARIDPIKRVR